MKRGAHAKSQIDQVPAPPSNAIEVTSINEAEDSPSSGKGARVDIAQREV